MVSHLTCWLLEICHDKSTYSMGISQCWVNEGYRRPSPSPRHPPKISTPLPKLKVVVTTSGKQGYCDLWEVYGGIWSCVMVIEVTFTIMLRLYSHISWTFLYIYVNLNTIYLCFHQSDGIWKNLISITLITEETGSAFIIYWSLLSLSC